MPPTPLTEPINFPYTAIDLTDAINLLPNMYGRIREMGFMVANPVTTTIVEVRFRDGVVTLLPTSERGGPPTLGKNAKENSIFLQIPHIPHEDLIKPEDLQNAIAFGNTRRQKTVDDSLSEKLQEIRNKHDITLEFMRMGALKGVITDGAGVVLYDLFDVFGIAKKTVNFELNLPATNVASKCREVLRHMEVNLRGEVMNGAGSLVSQEFFDALISHPNVEKFYLQFQDAQQLRGGDPRKGFAFGGLVFEEYLATASDINGVSQRFIDASLGHAWPAGTMQTFRTHFGPANTIDTVNTLGEEIFVSPKMLDHGKGIELWSESNPLPLCRRPALLVEMLEQ